MESDHKSILRLCLSDRNEAIAQKERCKKVREMCTATMKRLDQQREKLRALNERLSRNRQDQELGA